jgi:putative toxin-antitoxin system antitoxin component (TIGR02293 family)
MVEAAEIEPASDLLTYWNNLIIRFQACSSNVLQQPVQAVAAGDDSAIWRDPNAIWRRSLVASSNTREVEGIMDVLGGAKVLGRGVRSPGDLADQVRKGLPFAALSAVMEECGISSNVVCEVLQLSSRNFLRRRDQKRLSPVESDRLYRLARVLAHANRVFEDPDESAEWIQTPNTALGKQQPLTLLDTDIGVQQVDQVLGRIEHGIVG